MDNTDLDLRYIDCGTFSKVYAIGDTDRVVKIVQRFDSEGDMEKKLLDHELKLSSKWPFGDVKELVNVLDVKSVGKNKWYIFMENGGENLERFIWRGSMKKLDIMSRLGLMVDLLGAVSSLERRGFRHLDIKPKNILVKLDESEENSIWRAKLCDYDMLVPINILDTLGCDIIGTIRYLPPLDKLTRNFSRCIWALGMVFYEIAYGTYYCGDEKVAFKGSSFDNLIKGMLHKDDEKRYNIKDCKYELQNLLANIKSKKD